MDATTLLTHEIAVCASHGNPLVESGSFTGYPFEFRAPAAGVPTAGFSIRS